VSSCGFMMAVVLGDKFIRLAERYGFQSQHQLSPRRMSVMPCKRYATQGTATLLPSI
jgi:hypothetical protein